MTQGPTTAAPTASGQPSITARVQTVVDWLRPIIQADGGDVELVNVSADGIVQVRFHGACIGCPSSTMTLKEGLERNIREKVPEVRQVVPIPE
jgi:Fe-S cluster biogenesis protein NfuA